MTQVTRPNFTPEVIEWFNNPETTLEEIYSEYSDAYKSIQGIRPRWVAVWSTKEAAADDSETDNDAAAATAPEQAP